jgi:hypothetical protein
MNKKLFVMFVLMVVIALSGCNKPPEQPQQPDQPGQTIQQQMPDLSVAAVDISPSKPQAGVRFAGVVYVTNIGTASSGQYDIAMYMKDVSRGNIYPVGTFRQNPMQPGVKNSVWTSDQLMVNDPGSYQFWVEIKPFLFTDGNEQNNIYGKAFDVS